MPIDVYLEQAKKTYNRELAQELQTEVSERKKEETVRQISCLMGRAQAFSYMAQFGSMAELATLKEVKDQKLYREFGVSAWAEFCDLFGVKSKTIDERLLNLERFGLEFMETSQKIGLTSRDLRRIQALPSDTRVDAINQTVALENPTKEIVHDLLDRIEDQRTDIDVLKNKLEKSEAKLETKERSISRGQDQLTNLEDKIKHLQQQQEQSVIRNDEQKSLEVMDATRRDFHMKLLSLRSIDMDTASQGVKAALICLLEYMDRMLRDEIVTMGQAHPEIIIGDAWEVPGFVNPWDERDAAEDRKIIAQAERIKARKAQEKEAQEEGR